MPETPATSMGSKVFDSAIRFLLVFLPFSSFVTVWLTYGMGIPGVSFVKEIVLLIAILALGYAYLIEKNSTLKMRLGWLDGLIIAYMIIGVLVTIPTTGLKGLIYGGRYDYVFLVVFLLVYHGYPLLRQNFSYYLRLFLISAGVMLFISGLLKWPLTEDLLLFFGYSGNPSAWDFGGAPPIFQGVDGANVRRFQGLLDGPNAMGAFLILFSGVFAYYVRYRKDWYFIIALILIGLFGMIFYTYSRSALIGILVAYMIVIVMSFRKLYRLYRNQFIAGIVIVTLGFAAIFIGYYDKAAALIGRAGSTKGHAERMITGLHRVQAHPLGEGLGSAGPAYRHVMDLHGADRATTEETDRYYIPESWYIQQFVESGIIGGLLFLMIMAVFFFRLLGFHPVFGALFAGIGVMNLFLHTFESNLVSMSLFIILGLVLAQDRIIHVTKKR